MTYSTRLLSALGWASGMVPLEEYLHRYPADDRPQIIAALARHAGRVRAAVAPPDEIQRDCQADHDTARHEKDWT